MRLPKFAYLEPRTIDEACALLDEHRGRAKLLAGGTDLLVMMKMQLAAPAYLVNLKRIQGLNAIDYSREAGLTIGPLVTLRELAGSPPTREHYPLLADAAGAVASPHVRSTATIGGNLCLDAKCWYYNQSRFFQEGRTPCFKRGGDQCYAVKGGTFCYALVAADTAASLIALNARVKIKSVTGERNLPVAELFTGRGEPVNVLTPGEIVTEILVPPQTAGSHGAFIKQSFRRSIDFGIACAAVLLTKNADGSCRDARIALTAVSNAPVDAVAAAGMLTGRKIDGALAAAAGTSAAAETKPVSAIWTSVYHRRAVIAALVERAILQADGG